MFFLLSLLALVVQPATKPAPWIGTMEFRDSGGLTVGRITADLVVVNKTFTADWRSRGGASGSLSGTVDDKGRIKAALTIYGGALHGDGKIESERCRGEAPLQGQLHDGAVLRLTTERIRFDTPIQRVRERQCEDISRVVLLLQPLEH